MQTRRRTHLEMEHAFQRVHRERMQGVPIVNPELEVAAVGFRTWKGYNLGVMITPWFMSLVLLPGEHEPWPGLRIGDTRNYSFPSGTYEFLLGELDDIGRYMACSLFSTVFAFEDQATAVATAQTVMIELFKERDRPHAKRNTPFIDQADAAGQPKQPHMEGIVQNNEPPSTGRLSRRDFLRGKTRSD